MGHLRAKRRLLLGLRRDQRLAAHEVIEPSHVTDTPHRILLLRVVWGPWEWEGDRLRCLGVCERALLVLACGHTCDGVRAGKRERNPGPTPAGSCGLKLRIRPLETAHVRVRIAGREIKTPSDIDAAALAGGRSKLVKEHGDHVSVPALCGFEGLSEGVSLPHCCFVLEACSMCLRSHTRTRTRTQTPAPSPPPAHRHAHVQCARTHTRTHKHT